MHPVSLVATTRHVLRTPRFITSGSCQSLRRPPNLIAFPWEPLPAPTHCPRLFLKPQRLASSCVQGTVRPTAAPFQLPCAPRSQVQSCLDHGKETHKFTSAPTGAQRCHTQQAPQRTRRRLFRTRVVTARWLQVGGGEGIGKWKAKREVRKNGAGHTAHGNRRNRFCRCDEGSNQK